MNPDQFDLHMDNLIGARNLTIDADQRGHWWDALKDVEAPVFREAVAHVIAKDESYPTPARLRATCSSIMAARLQRISQPDPPSGLSAEEYTRWTQEWRRQVFRGNDEDGAERLAVEAIRHPALGKGGSGDASIEGSII